MREYNGWWLPDILTGPARYQRGWYELAPAIKPGRSVVQAGGHIGIFPRELSKLFQRVYTFEPGAENFACLVRNATADNVFASRAFLGDIHECRELRMGARNTGGHSVGGEGDTPTFRIDDLDLRTCDLILLDIEGYEFFALLGAMQTIARCKPRIICEENKKSGGQGFNAGALHTLLDSRGYKKPTAIGENLIFEAAK